MRHSLLTATVFLIGFGSGTLCGTAGTKTKTTAVSAGVEFAEQEVLLESFVDAWLDEDADRTVDLYTDNAVYMVPGAPMIHGRDAVRRHFAAEFTKRDGVGLEMTEPVQEVVSFGDWAVARGIGASIETGMGKSTSVTYKWMVLSQKQLDGSWKMAWDIYNSDAQ